MKIAQKDFNDATELLLRNKDLKSVTIFCSPLSKITTRVKATRKTDNEILITYGKPNYLERAYLKLCKKAKCNPRRAWFKQMPKK